MATKCFDDMNIRKFLLDFLTYHDCPNQKNTTFIRKKVFWFCKKDFVGDE